MDARPQGDRRAIARQRQASRPDELVAGKPAHQPLQLQDAERGHDLRGGEAGAGDQLIDADGMVVELAEQGALLVAEAKLGWGARRRERLVPWRVQVWRGTIFFIAGARMLPRDGIEKARRMASGKQG